MTIFLNTAGFLILQIAANLLFKWGGSSPAHYWHGFLLGNAAGITSILMMIAMYRDLPAPVVIAVATGGTFFLNQIVMFLVYREHLTVPAWAGVFLILAGILMTSLLNGPAGKPVRDSRNSTIQETSAE